MTSIIIDLDDENSIKNELLEIFDSLKDIIMINNLYTKSFLPIINNIYSKNIYDINCKIRDIEKYFDYILEFIENRNNCTLDLLNNIDMIQDKYKYCISIFTQGIDHIMLRYNSIHEGFYYIEKIIHSVSSDKIIIMIKNNISSLCHLYLFIKSFFSEIIDNIKEIIDILHSSKKMKRINGIHSLELLSEISVLQLKKNKK
jgi:hypothetical protein